MTKMKGLFKGIKNISNKFVYKEHEMEIGHPTDVRHVAHIGWDGGSVNSPGWMAQFHTTTTLGEFGQSTDVSWPSEEVTEPYSNSPKVPKKVKGKKPKVSSPSTTRSSSRSSKGRPRFSNGTEKNTQGLQDQI